MSNIINSVFVLHKLASDYPRNISHFVLAWRLSCDFLCNQTDNNTPA